MKYNETDGIKRTDRRRWRLRDDDSRHTWHYLEDDAAEKDWPQGMAEKYYLGLTLDLPHLSVPTNVLEVAENGMTFLERLQLPSGHWGCESGGPMTFSTGIVIAWYATKTPIPHHIAEEIQAYTAARTNPDGGWGLHTTDDSNICGTAINYMTMRILGMAPDSPLMQGARAFLRSHGGAVYSSTWGKFWMAFMNVADWDIVHPMPAEAWLMPEWVPIHPCRTYAESRMVSQTMCYIYSKGWQVEEDEFIRDLRREMLMQPYTDIDWAAHRTTVAAIDYKWPRTWVIDSISWTYLNIWRPFLLTKSLKVRGEAWLSKLIDMQAVNTDYGGIAATDSPMATIIAYFRGPQSLSFQRYRDKLQEFLWMTNEGMLINSTNGSQSWDTSFVLQAMHACGMQKNERWKETIVKALRFLDSHQVREDCVDQELCHRQQRRGTWTFSNKYQGFAVSDCTAEALRAILMFRDFGGYPQLEEQRVFDAIDSLILYQNKSGGCSAFEARRAGDYLEHINMTEIFAKQLVEYDYTECTASCITAMVEFRKCWPEYRTSRVNSFISRGATYIKRAQLRNGSWYGSWGICFTYGALFALEGLAAVGEIYNNCPASRKGCEFLLSKQRQDGGWSECMKGCETGEYIEDPAGSLVVQTAWAVIALMAAKYPDPEPIRRGVELIQSRQQANGEWLEEAIPGCFHGFCTFSYPNYKFSFTIRALGMFMAYI